MTTQREPDTSAEGRLLEALSKIDDLIAKRGDANEREVWLNEIALIVFNAIAERGDALADAAGHAAPVPPPVAEAKLAVYETPIGDLTTTPSIRANIREVVRPGGTLGWKEVHDLLDDFARLSAAHAECKGENTKLREALRPFAEVAAHDIGTSEDDFDWFRPISDPKLAYARPLTVGDLRAARAALAPASEEACSHPKTVLHHTGDGTPVEFCPDCGRNVAIGNPPVERDDPASEEKAT